MNLKSYRNKKFGEYISTKHHFDFLTAIYAYKYHDKTRPSEEHYNQTIFKWKDKLSKKGIEHINNNLDEIQNTLKLNIDIYKPYTYTRTNRFGKFTTQNMNACPVCILLVNSDNMFKPIIGNEIRLV